MNGTATAASGEAHEVLDTVRTLREVIAKLHRRNELLEDRVDRLQSALLISNIERDAYRQLLESA